MYAGVLIRCQKTSETPQHIHNSSISEVVLIEVNTARAVEGMPSVFS